MTGATFTAPGSGFTSRVDHGARRRPGGRCAGGGGRKLQRHGVARLRHVAAAARGVCARGCPVTLERFVAVDRYLTELLAPPDPVLVAALEANAAAGLPPHDVSPNQGKLLHVLARSLGARRDPRDRHARRLQHHLARARAAAGRSPDHARGRPEARRGRARQPRARRPRSAGRGARRPGAGDAAAARRREAGPFDLVFIDADKASNAAVLRLGARAVAPRQR